MSDSKESRIELGDFLFSICDECRVYSVEKAESPKWRKDLPAHIRHFVEKHLGHGIRFLFTDSHIDMIADEYTLSAGNGVFLTKKKDRKKYLKELEFGKPIEVLVPVRHFDGDSRVVLPSLSTLKMLFRPIVTDDEFEALKDTGTINEFFDTLLDSNLRPDPPNDRDLRLALSSMPKAVLKYIYDRTREKHPDRVAFLHPLIKEAGGDQRESRASARGEGIAMLFG
jgi:hypothetical protein